MTELFLRRETLTRRGNSRAKGEILISRPQLTEKGEYVCIVQFKPDSKYDDSVRGFDELHAVECAVAYVKSICQNSKDPEFFWQNGDSMYVENNA